MVYLPCFLEEKVGPIWADLRQAWILGTFGRGAGRINAVLPGGRLLADISGENVTVADAFHAPREGAAGAARRL